MKNHFPLINFNNWIEKFLMRLLQTDKNPFYNSSMRNSSSNLNSHSILCCVVYNWMVYNIYTHTHQACFPKFHWYSLSWFICICRCDNNVLFECLLDHIHNSGYSYISVLLLFVLSFLWINWKFWQTTTVTTMTTTEMD